jgi:transcriptional regulator with XRE-family HTH domain
MAPIAERPWRSAPVARERREASGVESNGRTFNEWLRSQLRVKKMSQRQLAMQAGVDHSTISRLLRGDRTPSLGTATKLARGLREVLDETETTRYFGVVENATVNPVARVEYALRSDDALSEAQVRRLMESYLSLRTRWLPNGAMDAAKGGRPANGRASRHPLVRTGGRPAF